MIVPLLSPSPLDVETYLYLKNPGVLCSACSMPLDNILISKEEKKEVLFLVLFSDLRLLDSIALHKSCETVHM